MGSTADPGDLTEGGPRPGHGGSLSATIAANQSTDSAKVIAKGVTFAQFPGTLRGTRRFNAAAFTQDPIQTLPDGTQFAVWVDTASHPIVGKRRFPRSEWETFDLATVAGNPLNSPTADDSHNSYSMIVDSQGYIHVSGNHHMTPLQYVRSTNPLDISAWTTPGMIGDLPEQTMSYPQFATLPNGKIIFTFRDEGPVRLGAYYLNVYDPTTKVWTRRGKLMDGSAAVPYQSPYINKLAIGPDGSIHIFFLWRPGQANDPAQSTNISHMKSSDEGVTWQTAGGTTLTVPLTYADATPVIAAGVVSGELNQSGAAVDSDGNPWSAWWRYDGTFNVGYGIYVRRWDGAAWVSGFVTQTGGGTADFTTLPRSQLFACQHRMFLLYAREPDALGVRLLEVTPGATNPVGDTMLMPAGLGRYEPVYDLSAIEARGELHMLVTPTKEDVPSANPSFAATWGGVLSIDLPSLFPQQIAGETRFIPATQMLNNGGTGTATINSVNSTPVASITDDTNTTEVVMQTQVPSDWNSFSITVLWMPLAGSPSGGVVFRANARWNDGGGGTTGPGTNIGNVTTSAPTTQYKATASTFGTELHNPPGGKRLFCLSVNRWAGNASDTLAGGLGILGVVLTRLT